MYNVLKGVILGVLVLLIGYDVNAQPANSFSPTTISRTISEPHGFMFFGNNFSQPYFQTQLKTESLKFMTENLQFSSGVYRGQSLGNHQVLVSQWKMAYGLANLVVDSSGLFTSCACGQRIYSTNFVGYHLVKKQVIGMIVEQDNELVRPGIGWQFKGKNFNIGVNVIVDPNNDGRPRAMGVFHVPF